ncbi:hypothetical protein COW36_24380 [bacterium (Candidatus Blackallbacteria) CG17_big_fil_post_rev_8_21_14_2_50_48_46]|uniref:VWFA domain-containing protein n=1 Tax=bacterium (Candidatus Blackallbacteria) CG17_big_fil_post_rev_8_21_14_2_50_48_46 TaxID=2014261 RepID=A0A2M7FX20_9BACT|nr:MAG: hypothetical protein COW64_19320 [bacterium (Candidatus Blackallbacteria) CG18_big_fil_WC_8_21_14_2_50_49_26]PIW13807.1 MAG: hypothetical protein COW36_24380 [bacterium (Candidatus Blackallbacteria) CG17_big_fil_post_rev_8_21_14_2_50_48_46]PIW45033.1 MAG: hypothetical protein COW20_22010 [bacterium (Candidatus Blackallbacteria) CG13_big_fil_rev_8_21_14_2_50_49_14]
MRLVQRYFLVFTLLVLTGWVSLHLGFLRLAYPAVLVLFLAFPLFFWMGFRYRKQQHTAFETWVAKDLWPRQGFQPLRLQYLLPLGLHLMILACLVIALARPQGPPVLAESQDQGIDLLMALDISDSSKAADLYPNRLEAAKQMIRQVLSRLSNDRVGLAVFSGEAFSVVPFTNDYAALDTLLTDIDPAMLPSRGTNIPALTQLAKERFERSSERGKVLIIFSDGENHEGNAVEAVKKLRSARTRIFTVGVGTTGGARIPEANDNWGSVGYKQYQGEPVVTRLNEGVLKSMASAGGGAYAHVEQPLRLLRELDRVRRELPLGTGSGTELRSYEERFQWYLGLALLLWGWEFLLAKIIERLKVLSVEWFERMSSRWIFPRLLRGVLRQGMVVGCFFLLQSAWIWPWAPFLADRAAQKAYREKKYEQSFQAFEQGIQAAPSEPRLYYNKGNALYQQKKYDQASEAYRRALSLDGNPRELAQTWYNLGNSYYRQGHQGADPQQNWQQALEAYQKALAINPEDSQAQENRDFVQAQLQALQEQNANQGTPQQEQQGKNQQNKSSGKPQPKSSAPPKGQGSSKPQEQGQSGSQAQNQFSDQEVQKFLQSMEENEKENRSRQFFQRFQSQDNALTPEDLLTRPLEDLEKLLNAKKSDQKDW